MIHSLFSHIGSERSNFRIEQQQHRYFSQCTLCRSCCHSLTYQRSFIMNPFDDQDKNPFVSANNEAPLNPFNDDSKTNSGTGGVVVANNNYLGTTNMSIDDDDDDDNEDDDDDDDNDIDAEDTQPLDSLVSAEASWQYLGDLPYRRVPIYTNVHWETTTKKNQATTTHPSQSNVNTSKAAATSSQLYQQSGLASFPSRSLPVMQQSSSKTTTSATAPSKENNNTTKFSNPRMMLSKTTMTKCVGCPNGGPIAVITIPITNHKSSTSSSTFNDTTMTVPLRILTTSGKMISCIDFPPPGRIENSSPGADAVSLQSRRYVPTDVMTMGFTNRCILIVVMKDSYCYTYNLRGEIVVPPFYILENSNIGGSTSGSDLQMAHIYEGGVAVLGTNKDSALVELFDNYDTDLDYYSNLHRSARCIVPTTSTRKGNVVTSSLGGTMNGQQQHHHVWIKNQSTESMPSNFAIVTYLPTAVYAESHQCYFCAIAVLPRARTLSRHPEVYVSTSDNSVVVVNAITGRCTDVNCRSRISSPIVDMTFAPNGRFLACFTDSSMLTVISASFETKVLDFDTSEGSNSPPLELKWCGEDSVVLHWKNLGILMVGPYGDWLRFPYEGMDNVFLIPEIDCCRVVTDTSVEVLQRVPPTTAQLLRIGSIDTAAMLLDASDAYHTGSTLSDDTARAIIESGTLDDAIEACTDAATKEFDISTQKRLLRAASYGLHFSYKAIDGETLIGGPVTGSMRPNNPMDFVSLPSKSAIAFVDAARTIRILNALRHPDVGFVATVAQFDAMTPTGVVARLIAMKRPSLASTISSYLRLPKSVQLYARACMAAAFIESAPIQLSDSEIAERSILIINNGSSPTLAAPNTNRGGYATVAQTANRVGRPGVANRLLLLESSVADKVPALLSAGSYTDALAVATTAR
jgi:vacuolar protein sorting-associated protein 16